MRPKNPLMPPFALGPGRIPALKGNYFVVAPAAGLCAFAFGFAARRVIHYTRSKQKRKAFFPEKRLPCFRGSL